MSRFFFAVVIPASGQPGGQEYTGQSGPPLYCIYNVRTFMYSSCAYKGPMGMPATGAKTRKNRDENINLRASQSQKALIDRAADALGRNRSDFMLETACREAEAVLLDRRYFALSSEEFKRFAAMLDKPPANNARLRRLLRTTAPWEQ